MLNFKVASLQNFSYVLMQLYPIVDILNKYGRGMVKGPALLEKLQSGEMFSRDEHIFFVKLLAKYLMEKCSV